MNDAVRDGGGQQRRVTGSLLSIAQDLDALRSRIDDGEPISPVSTLRGRIGFSVKRRLYRLMWWQTEQIRAAVNLMSRWSGGQINALEEMARNFQESTDFSQWHRDFEHRLQWLATTSSQRNHDFENRLQRLEAATAENGARLAEYASVRQQLISDVTQHIDAENAHREAAGRRLSELGEYTYQTRATLTMQERRLGLLLEQIRKQPSGISKPGHVSEVAEQESRHKYDSLYAAFEDEMRGSRDEIKARQAIYIDFLQSHGIGSPSMPVLDLGCGRGEWLEVLQENSLQASGVDKNETLVKRCRAFGLPVTQADALPYLSSLPDSSTGAVTAFHMVEHLPFDTLMTLIDDALRVLKPGGVILLETPNPSNVLVGATTFHYDPTHLKPLPSAMLRFFVEARGFCNVQVREMHPYPEALLLPEDSNGVAKRINEKFYGPQDYAVIGRKP